MGRVLRGGRHMLRPVHHVGDSAIRLLCCAVVGGRIGASRVLRFA
jgi:hypothetical protein